MLTCADLDQVLGLLLLREFQPLTVYATAAGAPRARSNSFFRMLQRVPNQLTWIEIAPGMPFHFWTDVTCTPIPLPGSLPFYARDIDDYQAKPARRSLGLLLESDGLRIAYTPSLPEITEELLDHSTTSATRSWSTAPFGATPN